MATSHNMISKGLYFPNLSSDTLVSSQCLNIFQNRNEHQKCSLLLPQGINGLIVPKM